MKFFQLRRYYKTTCPAMAKRVLKNQSKVYFRGKYHSYSWMRRLQKRKQKNWQYFHRLSSSFFWTNNDAMSVDHDSHVSSLQNTSLSSVLSDSPCQPVMSHIDSSIPAETSEIPIHPRHDDPTLKDELAYWTIQNGISIKALTNLLRILRRIVAVYLPKDGRTVLRTRKGVVPVKAMDDGYYFYLGIERNLRKLIRDCVIRNTTIILDFNIDGISVSKSNSQALWPILCRVETHVFVAALYLGKSKPNQCKEFLGDFVRECNKLSTENLNFNGTEYTFKIGNFIADAPAKSFALNIKGHNGYNSCLRCEIEGFWSKNRTTFYMKSSKVKKLPIRTKKKFRGFKYRHELQNGKTPLSHLWGFNPVRNTPFDYLHLLCLGIVKTLTQYWIRAKKKRFKYSLNYLQVLRVSKRFVQMRKYCPREFQRRSRSLEELPYWKAVEFRMMLLYTGIVAFDGILHERVYSHFLLLHFAMRCFSCSKKCVDNAEEAKRYIERFVDIYSELYGRHTISHNVHSLLHISQDVDLNGPLDTFAAFAFESFMQKLKKFVRTGPKALQQIIKRILEGDVLSLKPEDAPLSFPILGQEWKPSTIVSQPPLPSNLSSENYTSYTSIRMEYGHISTKRFADSAVFLNNGDVIIVCNVVQLRETKELFFVGRKFQSVGEFFSLPNSSTEVGVFEVTDLSTSLCIHPITTFYKKAFIVRHKRSTSLSSSYIAMEMLHCSSA